MKKFKPTKRLKALYRAINKAGGMSFKRFIRARIREGCGMARDWYQTKGYSADWLKK